MIWTTYAVVMFILIAIMFVLAVWMEHQNHNEFAKQYAPIDHSADRERAWQAYQQAQQNFNRAVEPQYIDIAISDLGASENRVNNELRKLRLVKGGETDARYDATSTKT